MSKTVNARFANGVFTPLEPVAFPEGTIVALSIEAEPTEPVVTHDGTFLPGMEDPQKSSNSPTEPPPGEPTPGNAGQSILEMFDEIHRSMPEGALDELPTDGSMKSEALSVRLAERGGRAVTGAAGEVFADTVWMPCTMPRIRRSKQPCASGSRFRRWPPVRPGQRQR